MPADPRGDMAQGSCSALEESPFWKGFRFCGKSSAGLVTDCSDLSLAAFRISLEDRFWSRWAKAWMGLHIPRKGAVSPRSVID